MASDQGDVQQQCPEGQTNLIVNYLPQSMSQEEFGALFSPIGEMTAVKLVRDRNTGKSLEYGFVNFQNPADAQKAIETLNGTSHENKRIKVALARPRSDGIKGANLYVSGIPRSMGEADLETMFSPYGKIILTRILRDKATGASKGVGFVRFDQRTQAEGAIEGMNGTLPPGTTQPLVVRFATTPEGNSHFPFQGYGKVPVYHQPPVGSAYGRGDCGLDQPPNFSFPMPGCYGGPGYPPAQMSGDRRLFVYNLAHDIKEQFLWKLFGRYGTVQNVQIMRDLQTNKGKGFGFVQMSTLDECMTAIQWLNGQVVKNRRLQVRFKSNGGRM